MPIKSDPPLAMAVESGHSSAPARRAVSLRSVLLGICGVVFICGLSPFNDFALANTFLVGNFLPIGLLSFFILFVALINAPLWRWAPRHAFDSGELAVALCMVLVSCTLPGSGLMRYLPSQLVGIPFHADQQADLRRLVNQLNLPEWMFPTPMDGEGNLRGNDPVVTGYIKRAPGDSDTFAERWGLVPWSNWMKPALTWGALLVAVYGAVICGGIIVQRQWVQNERLAFPLASIYLALIEKPDRGNAFNALFRSRLFHLGFAIPFLILLNNGTHQYLPQYIPAFQISFNLREVLSDPPWSYTDWGLRGAQVFFTVIGVSFFLQTKVALSLWLFYFLINGLKVLYGMQGSELTAWAQYDQQFGSILAYGAFVLWIGRAHWAMVLRQMAFRGSPGDPPAEYLPHAAAGWGFVLCSAGIGAWLVIAGASFIGAIVIVTFMMLMFLVVARVAAETGLIWIQIRATVLRPWIFMLNELPSALSARTTIHSYFYSSLFTNVFLWDLREALPVYSTHAMKVADSTVFPPAEQRWRRQWPLIACLMLALGVGYVVAGTSNLFVEYNYAASLDTTQVSPINENGLNWPKKTLEDTLQYSPPKTGPSESHSRIGHFVAGASITALLGTLHLSMVRFPLHPVGYLMAYSYILRWFWLSILIGWLLKVVIVRFGGSRMYAAARPFFIGLIVGECGAAAFWIVVNFVRHSMGLEFMAIRLLPM